MLYSTPQRYVGDTNSSGGFGDAGFGEEFARTLPPVPVGYCVGPIITAAELRRNCAGEAGFGNISEGNLVDGLGHTSDHCDVFDQVRRLLKCRAIDDTPFSLFREAGVLRTESRESEHVEDARGRCFASLGFKKTPFICYVVGNLAELVFKLLVV